ncbi:uncharacterized protein LOC121734729 [Aricia agestis]|uniref:uncharacterized protein LOC121734729 n=1 Tax=Aricia agestis TaxID=91739 RepID=UPI001C20790F|nr:uncharacterized protein LOC121734729 [Aricia agestis]
MDNDITIVPWVGPTSCKKNLNVAVVSSNVEVAENLSEALTDVQARGNYRWKLGVLRSLSLEDIVRQSNVTGRLAIDFIIIAMDTSKLFCVEWARKMLEHVHPDMRIRRVLLVNASGLPANAMAVSSSEVVTFCLENKLDMLNANLLKSDEAQFVARKILKYMEVSLGVRTGIPNLNI